MALATLALARWRKMWKRCPRTLLSLESALSGLCPSGRYFKISIQISFMYGLDSFQIVACALGLRMPFNCGNSILYSPVVLLDISPVHFQSLMFCGLVSQRRSRVVVPDVGHQPFAPQGETCFSEVPRYIGVIAPKVVFGFCCCCCCFGLGFSFGKTASLPLRLVLIWSFYSLLWSSCSIVLRLFSEQIIPYVAVDFVCL